MFSKMSLIWHERVNSGCQLVMRCTSLLTIALNSESGIQASSFGLDACLPSGRHQLSRNEPNSPTLCHAPTRLV
jgi:hypothetical protein